MTPAIRTARKAGVAYKLHEYQHDPAASSYGEEAAFLLGVKPATVFKTLLVKDTANKLAVAIVPVTHQLNLKKMAKALGVKKVQMAAPVDAEKATGYVLGGISPLGQKKLLPFVIDNSALSFDTIYVSAGRRGLEISLAPQDLIRLCDASANDIKG